MICFDVVADPANNGVSQTTEIVFKEAQKMTYRSGVTSLFVLQENVFNHPLGFGFKPFSPLFETFNDKIGRLIASGATNQMFEEYSLPAISKRNDAIGPQVLTMEHLEIGFIACLIPLGCAVVIFFTEIVFHAVAKAVLRYF